jgi:hypothetical protein
MPYTSKHRLFLTADRSRVVRADDPEAAYLFVGAGGSVSDEDAQRYGLKDLGDAPQVYDAKADHAAKHGNETQVEADAKHQAMLAGLPDPDGPAVEGERGGLADEEPVGVPKAVKGARPNKALAPDEDK